jgi:hypothetical protein
MPQLPNEPVPEKRGKVPRVRPQGALCWEMGPFEADRHRLSPPLQHGLEGETIPQIASNENLRQNPRVTSQPSHFER